MSLRKSAAAALAALLLATHAWAYRPFDGTDADVAETGEFELEAGLGRTRLGDADSRALPALVLNYGIARDTEINLEGQRRREAGATADAPRDSLADTALALKQVWVHGSLQDGTGPSVATECTVLLPEGHGGSRLGGEVALIVSQRWESMALHLNVLAGRTRERTNAGSVSLIAEGPKDWAVRPVAELLAERDTGTGGRLNSALVGAIWQRGEDLAFDVAVRRAHADEGTLDEVRVGLTWAFAVGK